MKPEDRILNPAEFYARPMEVVNDEDLTREQKIEILRKWEYEARELGVAEEENMSGGPPNRLGEVLEALSALGDDMGDEMEGDRTAPPTKQGGG